MLPDIISKLANLLTTGIQTEAEVVYLLVQVRKVLEHDQSTEYGSLKFHCDWALHTAMDRASAQVLLKVFDAANLELKTDPTKKLDDLPKPIRDQISSIIKLSSFKEELARFFNTYGLPSMIDHTPDGWSKFFKLYAFVIKDVPLEIKGTEGSVVKVVPGIELAKELHHGHQLYNIQWLIHDRNGSVRELFVINSFEAN